MFSLFGGSTDPGQPDLDVDRSSPNGDVSGGSVMLEEVMQQLADTKLRYEESLYAVKKERDLLRSQLDQQQSLLDAQDERLLALQAQNNELAWQSREVEAELTAQKTGNYEALHGELDEARALAEALQRERQDALDECDGLRQTVSLLQEQLRAQVASTSALDASVFDAHSHTALHATQQLEEAQQRIASFMQDLSTRYEERSYLQQQLAESQAAASQYQRMYEETSSQLQAQEGALAEREQALAAKETFLQSMQAQAASQSSSEIETLRSEVYALQSRLSTERDQHEVDLRSLREQVQAQASNSGLQQVVDQLQAELQYARERCEQAESTVSQMQSRVSSGEGAVEALQSEAARWRIEAESLQEQLQRVKAETSTEHNASRALSALQSAEKARAELSDVLAALSSNAGREEREAEQGSTGAAAMNGFADKEAYRRAREAVTAVRESMGFSLQAAEAAVAQPAVSTEQVEQLQSELRQAQSQVQAAQQELASARQELQERDSQVQQLSSDLQQLQGAFSALQAELHHTLSAAQKQQQEAESAKDALLTRDAEIAELTKRVQEWSAYSTVQSTESQAREAHVGEHLASLQAQLATAQQSSTELHAQVQALQTELHASRDRAAELDSMLSSLQSELQESTQQGMEGLLEISRLKEDMARAQAALEGAQQQMQEADARCAHLQAEASSLRDQCAAAEARGRVAQASHEGAVSAEAEQAARCAQLEAQVLALQQQLAATAERQREPGGWDDAALDLPMDVPPPQSAAAVASTPHTPCEQCLVRQQQLEEASDKVEQLQEQLSAAQAQLSVTEAELECAKDELTTAQFAQQAAARQPAVDSEEGANGWGDASIGNIHAVAPTVGLDASLLAQQLAELGEQRDALSAHVETLQADLLLVQVSATEAENRAAEAESTVTRLQQQLDTLAAAAVGPSTGATVPGDSSTGWAELDIDVDMHAGAVAGDAAPSSQAEISRLQADLQQAQHSAMEAQAVIGELQAHLASAQAEVCRQTDMANEAQQRLQLMQDQLASHVCAAPVIADAGLPPSDSSTAAVAPGGWDVQLELPEVRAEGGIVSDPGSAELAAQVTMLTQERDMLTDRQLQLERYALSLEEQRQALQDQLTSAQQELERSTTRVTQHEQHAQVSIAQQSIQLASQPADQTEREGSGWADADIHLEDQPVPVTELNEVQRARIEELQEQVERLQTAVAQLTEQLESATAAESAAAAQLQHVRSQMVETQSTEADLRGQLDRAAAEMLALQDRAGVAEAAVQAAQAAHNAQYQAVHDAHAQLTADKQAMVSQLQEAQERIVTLDEDKRRAESKLQGLQAQQVQAQATLDALQGEVARIERDAQRQYDEAVAEVEQELTTAQAEARDAKEEVSRLQQALQASHDELSSERADKDAVLSASKRAESALSAEVEELRHRVSQVTTQRKGVEEQLAQAQAALEAAESRMRILESDMKRKEAAHSSELAAQASAHAQALALAVAQAQDTGASTAQSRVEEITNLLTQERQAMKDRVSDIQSVFNTQAASLRAEMAAFASRLRADAEAAEATSKQAGFDEGYKAGLEARSVHGQPKVYSEAELQEATVRQIAAFAESKDGVVETATKTLQDVLAKIKAAHSAALAQEKEKRLRDRDEYEAKGRRRAMRDAESQMAALRQEHALAMAAAQAERDKLAREVQHAVLHQTEVQARTVSATSSQEVLVLRQQHEAAQAQVQALQRQLAAVESDSNDLTTRLQQCEAALTAARAQAVALNQQLSEAQERELHAAEQATLTASQFKARVDSLQAELSEATSCLTSAHISLQAAQAELAEVRASQANAEMLDLLQKQVDSLEQQLQASQAAFVAERESGQAALQGSHDHGYVEGYEVGREEGRQEGHAAGYAAALEAAELEVQASADAAAVEAGPVEESVAAVTFSSPGKSGTAQAGWPAGSPRGGRALPLYEDMKAEMNMLQDALAEAESSLIEREAQLSAAYMESSRRTAGLMEQVYTLRKHRDELEEGIQQAEAQAQEAMQQLESARADLFSLQQEMQANIIKEAEYVERISAVEAEAASVKARLVEAQEQAEELVANLRLTVLRGSSPSSVPLRRTETDASLADSLLLASTAHGSPAITPIPYPAQAALVENLQAEIAAVRAELTSAQTVVEAGRLEVSSLKARLAHAESVMAQQAASMASLEAGKTLPHKSVLSTLTPFERTALASQLVHAVLEEGAALCTCNGATAIATLPHAFPVPVHDTDVLRMLLTLLMEKDTEMSALRSLAHAVDASTRTESLLQGSVDDAPGGVGLPGLGGGGVPLNRSRRASLGPRGEPESQLARSLVAAFEASHAHGHPPPTMGGEEQGVGAGAETATWPQEQPPQQHHTDFVIPSTMPVPPQDSEGGMISVQEEAVVAAHEDEHVSEAGFAVGYASDQTAQHQVGGSDGLRIQSPDKASGHTMDFTEAAANYEQQQQEYEEAQVYGDTAGPGIESHERPVLEGRPAMHGTVAAVEGGDTGTMLSGATDQQMFSVVATPGIDMNPPDAAVTLGTPAFLREKQALHRMQAVPEEVSIGGGAGGDDHSTVASELPSRRASLNTGGVPASHGQAHGQGPQVPPHYVQPRSRRSSEVDVYSAPHSNESTHAAPVHMPPVQEPAAEISTADQGYAVDGEVQEQVGEAGMPQAPENEDDFSMPQAPHGFMPAQVAMTHRQRWVRLFSTVQRQAQYLPERTEEVLSLAAELMHGWIQYRRERAMQDPAAYGVADMEGVGEWADGAAAWIDSQLSAVREGAAGGAPEAVGTLAQLLAQHADTPVGNWFDSERVWYEEQGQGGAEDGHTEGEGLPVPVPGETTMLAATDEAAHIPLPDVSESQADMQGQAQQGGVDGVLDPRAAYDLIMQQIAEVEAQYHQGLAVIERDYAANLAECQAKDEEEAEELAAQGLTLESTGQYTNVEALHRWRDTETTRIQGLYEQQRAELEEHKQEAIAAFQEQQQEQAEAAAMAMVAHGQAAGGEDAQYSIIQGSETGNMPGPESSFGTSSFLPPDSLVGTGGDGEGTVAGGGLALPADATSVTHSGSMDFGAMAGAQPYTAQAQPSSQWNSRGEYRSWLSHRASALQEEHGWSEQEMQAWQEGVYTEWLQGEGASVPEAQEEQAGAVEDESLPDFTGTARALDYQHMNSSFTGGGLHDRDPQAQVQAHQGEDIPGAQSVYTDGSQSVSQGQPPPLPSDAGEEERDVLPSVPSFFNVGGLGGRGGNHGTGNLSMSSMPSVPSLPSFGTPMVTRSASLTGMGGGDAAPRTGRSASAVRPRYAVLTADEVREKEAREKEKERERMKSSGFLGTVSSFFGRKPSTKDALRDADVDESGTPSLDPDKPPPMLGAAPLAVGPPPPAAAVPGPSSALFSPPSKSSHPVGQGESHATHVRTSAMPQSQMPWDPVPVPAQNPPPPAQAFAHAHEGGALNLSDLGAQAPLTPNEGGMMTIHQGGGDMEAEIMPQEAWEAMTPQQQEEYMQQLRALGLHFD